MNRPNAIRILVLGALVVAFASDAIGQDSSYANRPMVFPDQGWSAEDRLRYYNTSQGSAALWYDIFLGLENAHNQELFRSDATMRGYGLIPQPSDPVYNPDGLPIGVTKTSVAEGRWKGEWVGLTCAACHDAELEYRGTTIKVSGGSNKDLDLHALIQGLDDTLAATLADEDKFERLAQRLGAEGTAARDALRSRVEENAASVREYNEIVAATPSVVGPGRVDALRLIHNQVQSNWMAVPQNWVAPLAPAKYSFAWNIPQSAWAQWSGVLFDPLLRNGGESVGVFVRFDATSDSRESGLFESTIDFRGQIDLEDLLRRLAPPPWPEDVLGTIDWEKAASGAALFAENCAGCHSTWPHRWSEPRKQGKRFIENAIVPVDIIGTDPGQFTSPQFETWPTVRSGPMRAHLEPPFTGATLAPPPVVFAAVADGVFSDALAALGLSEEELTSAHGYRPFGSEPPEPIPVIGGYKANPAEGMWAAPPYLHNGSVPNLYELLLPASERSTVFFIGREFDPVKVGVDTSGKSGKFVFDTTLVGNANSGHSFENGSGRGIIGRLLSDEERWAIIEYMKSIPNEPGQISPFGGPENPVRAWKDETFFHVRNPGTYNGAPDLSANPAADSRASGGGPGLGEEVIDPTEAGFIEFITQATIDRLLRQFPPGTEPVLRDAHPKTHALVRAEFIVLGDLPEELRHGIFEEGRVLDAIIRFSAGGIEVKSDTVPQANGMAIKLLGVEGEKILEGEKDAETQDFVMINNFPSFFVRNLADYQTVHEVLASGDPTDGTAAFFRDHPEELSAVRAMRGDEPLSSPFEARYWSQTPYKLGPHAMKFSAAPITALAPGTQDTSGPDHLRDVAFEQVGRQDVYFDFLVQLQTDPEAMPVEDSLVVWDEARSPFRRVALIRIPKQDLDVESNQQLAETLSFNPWHSVPELRPIGAMNRARKAIYEALAEFRHGRNGVEPVEPTVMPVELR